MTRIVVTDANIFFDLIEIDILDIFFELPYQISTTLEILNECDPPEYELLQPFLAAKKLNILTTTLDKDNFDFQKGLSLPDISILLVALEHGAIALSGERKMAKWCSLNQVDSHGIIWVLEQFVINNLIDKIHAADLLEILISLNEWLPIKICQEYIKKWRRI